MPKKLLIFLLLFIPGLATCTDAHAVFQLLASPRRGGQMIRFESAEPGRLLRNEEVTVGVSTDRGVQYQILQNLYQPLTNEFGNTIPAGSFIQFSPSNPAGTLRTQLETPILMGQKQIYTSSASGQADEFVLVFNVRVPENQPGGVYHTQLTLTAEPVNATAGVGPSTVTLDVRVEINPKFRLLVQSAHGGRSVEFPRITKENPRASAALAVQIDSNIGTRYRVMQQLTELPTSSEGETLPEDALSFRAKGGSPSALKASPSMLYESNEWGGSDAFTLELFVDPDPAQKAGIYTGSVSFRIESNSPFASQEIVRVPIRVEIETIFSLETTIETGNLNFGAFKTGQEKQEKTVVLKVRSNLGAPYQVSQVVPRRMTNSEGGTIPDDHFKFFGVPSKTGRVAVSSPVPVKEGETVVFMSDPKGTPEEFTLDYTLTIPPGTKAGSYNSELKYSITTL